MEKNLNLPKMILPFSFFSEFEMNHIVFAISAHRAKRKKGISKSLLDQIEGIGSIEKELFWTIFGSARAVESASLDEIKSVEGVEVKVAKKIYNFFHE